MHIVSLCRHETNDNIVKQELAREGILPCAKFFGSSYDLSWRKLLNLIRGRPAKPSTLQETPVGALFLHWVSTVFTVLMTWPLDPTSAYSLLISISAYLFVALFPTVIARGMLYLHLNPKVDWSSKLEGFSNSQSLVSAAVVAIVGLFPIVMEWIPPSNHWEVKFPWYSTALISWALVVLCIVYWIWLRYMLPRLGGKGGKKLLIVRDPHFSQEDGYPVLEHEIVQMRWIHEQEPSTELRPSDVSELHAEATNPKWV